MGGGGGRETGGRGRGRGRGWGLRAAARADQEEREKWSSAEKTEEHTHMCEACMPLLSGLERTIDLLGPWLGLKKRKRKGMKSLVYA